MPIITVIDEADVREKSFMPRLNALADVLFPVELQPVFAGASDGRPLLVSDKRAIVDADRGRVLGIVSRDYRLVTNREALDWAYQCCKAVFPDTKETEWEAMAVDAPATGGHCFIDLIHNTTALDFNTVPAQARPDVFGPFIRLTNSYNGLRSLSFNVGFLRKVCKNGLILPQTIITFSFAHLRRKIAERIEFQVSHERLAHLKNSFGSYIEVLRSFQIPRQQIDPFVGAIIGVRTPKQLRPKTREAADWEALTVHLRELGERYATELGENAYAVLNAVTEFASHPPVNCHVHRERHGLQRLAGVWLTDFSKRCTRPDFDLSKYLTEIQEAASNDDDSSVEAHPPSQGSTTEWYARRLFGR